MYVLHLFDNELYSMIMQINICHTITSAQFQEYDQLLLLLYTITTHFLVLELKSDIFLVKQYNLHCFRLA